MSTATIEQEASPVEVGTLTIHQAIALVMAEVGPVGKTGWNDQNKYKFRGIDAVVDASSPVLAKHGVHVLPELLDVAYQTVEVGKNRTIMRECTVKVRYTFFGPRGDSIAAVVPGEALDSGDKATAKAMSVALRIALLQALQLPTGDRDTDQDSPVRSSARDVELHDVKSDPVAVEKARTAIVAAPDADELRLIWKQVASAARPEDGRLTPEDRDELHRQIERRFKEVPDPAADGQIASAAQPKPDPPAPEPDAGQPVEDIPPPAPDAAASRPQGPFGESSDAGRFAEEWLADLLGTETMGEMNRLVVRLQRAKGSLGEQLATELMSQHGKRLREIRGAKQ